MEFEFYGDELALTVTEDEVDVEEQQRYLYRVFDLPLTQNRLRHLDHETFRCGNYRQVRLGRGHGLPHGVTRSATRSNAVVQF